MPAKAAYGNAGRPKTSIADELTALGKKFDDSGTLGSDPCHGVVPVAVGVVQRRAPRRGLTREGAWSGGAEALALVAAVLHAAAPFLIIQVPLHRLADAGLEGLFRPPAKLALDLVGVDGVAQVVAGAVCHVGDQVAIVS